MNAQSIKIFAEGDFVRWAITDANGTEYVDGGNYRTAAQAVKGVAQALGMEIVDDDSISVADAQELARLSGIDPRANEADGIHWPHAPTFAEVARALGTE